MGRKRRAHERDSDDEERPRPRRVFIGEFRPENISRLFRKYHGEWHPRSDERFLTQNEFVNLIDELHTTKITEIHDEGMRRIRHGELPFDIPGAKRRNSRRVRPTDSYRPTRDLSTSADSYRPAPSRSLSSLASQPSTRTPTPQPRTSRLSTPFTYEQDKPSSRLSEIRTSSAQTTPFHSTAPLIKTQPPSSPAEQKSSLANASAKTSALASTSPSPPLQAPSHEPLPSSPERCPRAPLPDHPLTRPQTKTNTPLPPPQPESLPPPPPPHYDPATPPHHAQKQQQSHRRAVTTALMNAIYAEDLSRMRIRHQAQVADAKRAVWDSAVGMAGEFACLRELIGKPSGDRWGVKALTETALVDAYGGLMELKEGKERLKRRVEEVVSEMEGVGMGSGVIGEVERLEGLMEAAERVKGVIERCLVIMKRREVVLDAGMEVVRKAG